jgi:LacI family transcriptional regulator
MRPFLLLYFLLMSSSGLTIKDIAQKAGVSIATISRAMSPHTRSKVAPETLKHVDALIKQYGYSSNLAARHLRQSSTKTIGIIFPYVPGIFYSIYYTHILAGITEYLLETEYRFKMLLLKEGSWWDDYNFRSAEGVDGLIIIHWFKIFSNPAALERINIPFMILNDFNPQIKASFVSANQSLGGRMAAEHLYNNGHTNVGVLRGPDWSVDSQMRLEGFQSFFKEKGIVIGDSQIEDGKYLEQEAYNHVGNLVQRNAGITAIFCCNDQMVFGAQRKLKELGIQCPQDISLIGFDDEIRSSFNDPALTTIHVDIPTMAKEAAQRLLEQLKDPHISSEAKIFEPTLIKRQSVRKIN